MQPLTQKQIEILKVLASKAPVIAPWNHRDLCALRTAGLAVNANGHQASGRVSSNSVWSITAEGRRFLEEERAGQ